MIHPCAAVRTRTQGAIDTSGSFTRLTGIIMRKYTCNLLCMFMSSAWTYRRCFIFRSREKNRIGNDALVDFCKTTTEVEGLRKRGARIRENIRLRLRVRMNACSTGFIVAIFTGQTKQIQRKMHNRGWRHTTSPDYTSHELIPRETQP